jgi:hypothetical protein
MWIGGRGPCNVNRNAAGYRRRNTAAPMARWGLLVLLLSVLPVAMAEEGTEAVIFNTICAQCHEGECSGRLSFESGRAGAASHIRRYAGATSAEALSTLYAMLRYTKEHCGYPPMVAKPPPSGSWDASALAAVGLPNRERYFIPLGSLSAGRHVLRLSVRAPAAVRIDVTSSAFDVALEKCLTLAAEPGSRLEFEVPERAEYFLRVVGREAVPLERLELDPPPGG